jgi:hypothetical protein
LSLVRISSASRETRDQSSSSTPRVSFILIIAAMPTIPEAIEIPRRRQRIAGHANEPGHHELGGPAENGDGERIGDGITAFQVGAARRQR